MAGAYGIDDLLACCSALGSAETMDGGGPVKYHRGDEALDVVRDLQRYLRRDDANKTFLRKLGEWNIVASDLFPLLTSYPQDHNLAFNTLKLVTMLSMPPDEDAKDFAAEITGHLQLYKEAVLEQRVLPVLLGMCVEALAVETPSARTESQQAILELVLSLVRNLMAVPDPAALSRAGGGHREHLHVDFVVECHSEYVTELLLVLANSSQEKGNKELALLLLEIFAAMFRGVNPEVLATSDQHTAGGGNRGDAADETGDALRRRLRGDDGRSASDGPQAKPGSLRAIVEAETRKKTLKANAIGSRHSRFGGSFAYTGEDGRIRSWNKDVRDVGRAGRFDSRSKRRRKRPAPETRPFAASTRYGLPGGAGASAKAATVFRAIADEFVVACYNALMNVVIEDISFGSNNVIGSDEVNFFLVDGFFTAYHRARDMARVARELETYLPPLRSSSSSSSSSDSNEDPAEKRRRRRLRKLRRDRRNNAYDDKRPAFDPAPLAVTTTIEAMAVIEKFMDSFNSTRSWAPLHAAVYAFRQKLLVLGELEASRNSSNEALARNILSNLFYEDRATGQLVDMVKKFKTTKQPASFMVEMISTIHVLLRVLHKCTNGKSPLFKRRFRRKRVVVAGSGDGTEHGQNPSPMDATSTAVAAADGADASAAAAAGGAAGPAADPASASSVVAAGDDETNAAPSEPSPDAPSSGETQVAGASGGDGGEGGEGSPAAGDDEGNAAAAAAAASSPDATTATAAAAAAAADATAGAAAAAASDDVANDASVDEAPGSDEPVAGNDGSGDGDDAAAAASAAASAAGDQTAPVPMDAATTPAVVDAGTDVVNGNDASTNADGDGNKEAPKVEYEWVSEAVDEVYDFSQLVRVFADRHVVENYLMVLRDFATNAAEVNKHILRLFHRIAVDCKLEGIFYQVSVLNLLNEIAESREVDRAAFKEWRRFAAFITRGFLKAAAEDPNVFVEALFWKSQKRMVELSTAGRYDRIERQERARKRRGFSDVDDSHIREAFVAAAGTSVTLGDLCRSIADRLGDRTEASVRNRAKKLGLQHQRRQWSEEEDAAIRKAYAEAAGTVVTKGDLHESIAASLNDRSKGQVATRARKLELQHDRLIVKHANVKRSSSSRRRRRIRDDGVSYSVSASVSDGGQARGSRSGTGTASGSGGSGKERKKKGKTKGKKKGKKKAKGKKKKKKKTKKTKKARSEEAEAESDADGQAGAGDDVAAGTAPAVASGSSSSSSSSAPIDGKRARQRRGRRMIDSDEDDEAHLGDDFDLFGSMRRSQVSQPLAGDGAGNDDNGGGANGDALEEVEDEISEPPFGADRKAFWVRRLVRMDNDRGLAALQWLGRWLGRAYHERQGRQRVAIFDGDYGVFNIVPENDEDRAMLKIPYLQRLMTEFGINRPNAIETFWRVDRDITPRALKNWGRDVDLLSTQTVTDLALEEMEREADDARAAGAAGGDEGEAQSPPAVGEKRTVSDRDDGTGDAAEAEAAGTAVATGNDDSNDGGDAKAEAVGSEPPAKRQKSASASPARQDQQEEETGHEAPSVDAATSPGSLSHQQAEVGEQSPARESPAAKRSVSDREQGAAAGIEAATPTVATTGKGSGDKDGDDEPASKRQRVGAVAEDDAASGGLDKAAEAQAAGVAPPSSIVAEAMS